MKARKFILRDRTTAGRATGSINCRLLLPAIGKECDWRVTRSEPDRSVGKIRRFINRHLPKFPDQLIGATFVINAEIRESPTRLGRLELVRWNQGDNMAEAFEKTAAAWVALEFEEDWRAVEVEIEI